MEAPIESRERKIRGLVEKLNPTKSLVSLDFVMEDIENLALPMMLVVSYISSPYSKQDATINSIVTFKRDFMSFLRSDWPIFKNPLALDLIARLFPNLGNVVSEGVKNSIEEDLRERKIYLAHQFLCISRFFYSLAMNRMAEKRFLCHQILKGFRI